MRVCDLQTQTQPCDLPNRGDSLNSTLCVSYRPAITFRRYAEAGKTRIRDPLNGKVCRTILGYDANSLYLWATKQAMACQLPRRWDRQEDGSFKGSAFYRNCLSEISWLEWESFVRGIKIYHRFNGGCELFGRARRQRITQPKLKPEESARKDMKIEGVSVDGYDPDSRTCYFFDGCKWHAHIRRIRDPTDRRYGRRDYGQPCVELVLTVLACLL